MSRPNSKANEGLIDNIWGLLIDSSRMQFLDEYMGDMNAPLMITMGAMSMPQTNEELADALGVSKSEALKFISQWAYDNGITDHQLYTESKASEFGQRYFHLLDASAEDIMDKWLEDKWEGITADEISSSMWDELEKTDGGSRFTENDIQNYIDEYFDSQEDGEESKANELGIGSTFNMSSSASDAGEQEYWCRHIGTGGIQCGEPFPEHFDGRIEDHDFYPIAQSTQDQMDGKLNESKATEEFDISKYYKEVTEDDGWLDYQCNSCGKKIEADDGYGDKDYDVIIQELKDHQINHKFIYESKASESSDVFLYEPSSDVGGVGYWWDFELPLNETKERKTFEDLDIQYGKAWGYLTQDEQKRVSKYKSKLGESDIYKESWNQASSINRIEALEKIGIKQGDAIKLSSLEFEDFGEDLQGALKGDLEDARKKMKAQKAFLDKDEDNLADITTSTGDIQKFSGFKNQKGGEVDNPNSEFDQSYPDYNNIGESQTRRTSYECDLCDNGFKSNEALSVHHNDKHAIAPKSLDGYASERLARDDEETYDGYWGHPKGTVKQTGNCPNCGHDVGQHSGANTGDNICYGGNCDCVWTFPWIKESKASEYYGQREPDKLLPTIRCEKCHDIIRGEFDQETKQKAHDHLINEHQYTWLPTKRKFEHDEQNRVYQKMMSNMEYSKANYSNSVFESKASEGRSLEQVWNQASPSEREGIMIEGGIEYEETGQSYFGDDGNDSDSLLHNLDDSGTDSGRWSAQNKSAMDSLSNTSYDNLPINIRDRVDSGIISYGLYMEGESKANEVSIDDFKRIKDNLLAEKLNFEQGSALVDIQTANAIVAVWDNINEEQRLKFPLHLTSADNVARLAGIAFKSNESKASESFVEDDHQRDEGGQFTSGGSGWKTKEKTPYDKKVGKAWIVGSNITGGYTEEEFYDLDEAKAQADKFDGQVTQIFEDDKPMEEDITVYTSDNHDSGFQFIDPMRADQLASESFHDYFDVSGHDDTVICKLCKNQFQAATFGQEEAADHLYWEHDVNDSWQMNESKSNESFDMHSDAGHGWLKVPKSLLKELGIGNDISMMSYQKGNSVFIEEDGDLSTFKRAYEEKYGSLSINELPQTDDESPIRDYYPYSGESKASEMGDVLIDDTPYGTWTDADGNQHQGDYTQSYGTSYTDGNRTIVNMPDDKEKSFGDMLKDEGYDWIEDQQYYGYKEFEKGGTDYNPSKETPWNEDEYEAKYGQDRSIASNRFRRGESKANEDMYSDMSLSEFLGQWDFTMDDAKNVAERLGISNLEELKNLGDDFFYHANNYHEEMRSLKQEADDEFKWSEEDRIKRGISTDDYYKLNESKASEDDPDFDNDADFEGKINGASVEPSQYTQSGMDHTDYGRGDIDESKASEFNTQPPSVENGWVRTDLGDIEIFDGRVLPSYRLSDPTGDGSRDMEYVDLPEGGRVNLSVWVRESKASEAGLEDHVCAECGFVTSDNSEYIDHLNSHEE